MNTLRRRLRKIQERLAPKAGNRIVVRYEGPGSERLPQPLEKESEQLLSKLLSKRMSTGRLAAASAVGTTLEWYDFTLYNTLAALIFNRLFSPSFDPLIGTILAFSTYAVGYT